MASSPVSTVASKNFAEAVLKTQHLYRRAMKSAPRIIQMYDLPFPIKSVRQRIADEFRKHHHVKDPVILDMLYFKGKNDLDELLMQWKQRGHVMTYFAPHKKEESDFLKKFYANEDIE